MKEGSKWWCLLRPASASRGWLAALKRNEDLVRQRDALQASLDEARERMFGVMEEFERERAARESLEVTSEELRQELSDARGEMQRTVPMRMELEGMRADIGELKQTIADRDSRIRHLRENLDATRRELRQAYNLPAESELIDWDESSPEQPREPQFPPSGYPKVEEASGSSESSRTPSGPRSSRIPEGADTGEETDDDDDWLQELPK